MSNEVITKDVEIARQLEAAFQVYVKDISPLVATALANAGTKRGTNKKYEWYEYSRQRVTAWVTVAQDSGYFTDTPKAFDIPTANVLVGDTFRFETTAWVSLWDLTIYVTEIVSTSQVKAIKVGWTDVAIPVGTVAVFKSNLLPENSKKGESRKITVPSIKYNYFQIFDTLVENSRTLEGSNVIWDIGKIANLRAEGFYQIQRQLTEILANGLRAKFTDPVSGKEIYGAGWIGQYVVNTIDAAWAVFAQTFFDDAVEKIIKWGWVANAVRCNTKQARAISKLDNSKIQINLNDATRWNVVTALQAGIPVKWSKIDMIIVDTTMPEDEIDVFDMNNIALIPYSNWAIREIDATEKGQDWNSIRMLWEYTVEAKNMEQTAVRITNLG